MSRNVGLIGVGHWGRNLARNFDKLGALGAVCEAAPERLETVAAQYPDAHAHAAYDTVMRDPAIDAVVIATPAATHGTLVAAALAADKHVFVEKPLCLDIEQGEALRIEAARRGLVLMVGHLMLYHPAFVALAELVARGGIGPLRYIYSNRLNLGKIRREENALWSFAPHDVSMILHLAGEMPVSVNASAAHYLTEGVADTTLSQLEFAGQLQAHIFVSWLHPYKDQRLVVVGEDAMVVFNDAVAEPDKLLVYRHKAHWDGELPVVDKAAAVPVAHERGEPLKIECEAFLRAVDDGVAPPSDAAEGLRVLKVLDACQRSIAAGRRVAVEETVDA